MQEGTAGLHDVCISLPSIVGRSGASTVLEPAALMRSAQVLREAYVSTLYAGPPRV